jgi:predicted Zn-dependent protease
VSYENPQVPHEVNVSRDSVLVEFVQLAAGVGLVAIAIAAALYFFGGYAARLVPYSVEQEWVGDRVLGPVDVEADGDAKRVQPYLQRLADDLARHMDLPKGMRPVVHWADTDVPNAFATLGGHVVVTRGLYERMPSENALAMVIAHELAHVRERDPIGAVGGSASLALVLVLLGGDVDRLVPHLAHAVQLGYSRSAERRADDAALQAVVARYGHAGGAAAVFEVLAAYAGSTQRAAPTLLSTHPADEDRIARLADAARDWDPARQPLRPLEVSLPRDAVERNVAR